MDGEPSPTTSIRWSLVFVAVAVFGLLVVVSGFVFASLPITLQGSALLAVGVIGSLVTGARGPAVPRRRPSPVSSPLPSPVPLALPAAAVILVATAVESARTGLSVWAPLGLLTGVTLLGLIVQALPAPPRPRKEAVPLVVAGLVLMVGYEALRHLFAPSVGDLPSYLAAVGMPFAATIGAGALAVLAATRAGLAAAGATVLAVAGLNLARAAGDAWWVRHADFAGETAAPILVQTHRMEAEQSAVAISVGGTGEFAGNGTATVLLVVGLALVVGGWWWAAARRTAG
jgi:hypothetical protein